MKDKISKILGKYVILYAIVKFSFIISGNFKRDRQEFSADEEEEDQENVFNVSKSSSRPTSRAQTPFSHSPSPFRFTSTPAQSPKRRNSFSDDDEQSDNTIFRSMLENPDDNVDDQNHPHDDQGDDYHEPHQQEAEVAADGHEEDGDEQEEGELNLDGGENVEAEEHDQGAEHQQAEEHQAGVDGVHGDEQQDVVGEEHQDVVNDHDQHVVQVQSAVEVRDYRLNPRVSPRKNKNKKPARFDDYVLY